MKKYVIIVAGGSGVRMGTSVSKQFLVLGDKPVLMHTIDAFYNAVPDIRIILVLPENQINYWQEICCNFNYQKDYTIVAGGQTRYESVKNGLTTIDVNSLVAIHDGVRPFPGNQMIKNIFREALIKGNAVPAVALTDSIRKITGEGNTSVDRSKFRLVQTPQCFQAKIVLKAYEQEYKDSFTDDASIAEAAGFSINLVEGETSNIKITKPEDLEIADSILKKQNSK